MNTNKELNQFEKLAKLIRQILIVINFILVLLASGLTVYQTLKKTNVK